MFEFSLVGGVGNQLFIAHAALYAEQVLGHKVRLFKPKVSRGDTNHNSWLGDFRPLSPNFTIADMSDLSSLKEAQFFLRRTLYNLELKFQPEKAGQFSRIWRPLNPGFVELPIATHVFCQAYFASHLYRSGLPAPPELEIANPSQWLTSMLASGLSTDFPVAWHLRRGDFMKLKESFGILSEEYYFNATEKYGFQDLPVAIFTDSPELLSDELLAKLKRRGYYVVPKPPGGSDSEVLALMSQHPVLLVANSSFSLWAAVRAHSKGGTVIRPSRVFRNLEEPNDLYPDNWLMAEASFVL